MSETGNPLRMGLETVKQTDPATIVILGATGDLTRRKLMPAIYNLAAEGLLHPETRIVGLARREWSDQDFRDQMRAALEEHSRRPVEDQVFDQLARDMAYVPGTFEDAAAFRRLGETLEVSGDGGSCRLFYLATPPSTYADIVAGLGEADLVARPGEDRAARIIVEKPFGHDLESAVDLNRRIHRVFDESQIFRIDHYLGKETVQNLLVFRLDNGIFEPLWNRRYVDHVQIAVAESVGVGTRAGYYEGVGVIRDMFQNHIMQLLTLLAMEPPVRFDAKAVRDEKVKVLAAIRPLEDAEVDRAVVRGQYTAGIVGGTPTPGYLEAEGVAPDSRTETFLAARLVVENWRWGSTPFYLRSGKCLPKRVTEIAIVYKTPPHELFPDRKGSKPRPNVLRIRIQPEEGISLSFESKAPGQTMHIEEVRMDFSYTTSFGGQSPEAYERLLLDAIQGDSTLFAREDEVELSWALVDRIVAAWSRSPEPPEPYAAGTWGPSRADALIRADGRRWLEL